MMLASSAQFAPAPSTISRTCGQMVEAKDTLLLKGTVPTVGVTIGRSSLSHARASLYEEEEGAEVLTSVLVEFVKTSIPRRRATCGRFSMAECLAKVSQGGKVVISSKALPKCRQEDDDPEEEEEEKEEEEEEEEEN